MPTPEDRVWCGNCSAVIKKDRRSAAAYHDYIQYWNDKKGGTCSVDGWICGKCRKIMVRAKEKDDQSRTHFEESRNQLGEGITEPETDAEINSQEVVVLEPDINLTNGEAYGTVKEGDHGITSNQGLGVHVTFKETEGPRINEQYLETLATAVELQEQNKCVAVEEQEDTVPEPAFDLLRNLPIEVTIKEETENDVPVSPMDDVADYEILTAKKASLDYIYRKYDLEAEDRHPENSFVKFFAHRENENFKKQTECLAKYRRYRGDLVDFRYSADPLPEDPFNIQFQDRYIFTNSELVETYKLPKTASFEYIFKKFGIAEEDQNNGNRLVRYFYHRENEYMKKTAHWVTRYKRIRLRLKPRVPETKFNNQLANKIRNDVKKRKLSQVMQKAARVTSLKSFHRHPVQKRKRHFKIQQFAGPANLASLIMEKMEIPNLK